MKGITFSLLSGFLAATASLCGKFSMAAEETLMLCEFVVQKIHGIDHKSDESFTYSPLCHNVSAFQKSSVNGSLIYIKLYSSCFYQFIFSRNLCRIYVVSDSSYQ